MNINFLNEQTIYDAFFMTKPEFVTQYVKYFPTFTKMEAQIIWDGIKENFEYITKGYIKSSQLDNAKFLEWKKSVCIELTEVEEKSLIRNEKDDIAKEILENNRDYKWNTDKIREFWRAGFTEGEIYHYFQRKMSISYINQYKPK